MTRSAQTGGAWLFLLGLSALSLATHAEDEGTGRRPAAWTLAQTQGFHPTPRDTASVFDMSGSSSFGAFGGYAEALDISGATAPSTNTFFDDLFLFNASTRTWHQVSGNGAGPAPRAFACAVYHEASESVIVFGGTQFEADFSAFTYFDDLWQFDLASATWSALQPTGARPSARAGFGCDIIDEAIYLFSGNGDDFNTDNELWRYDIAEQAWTLVQADAPDDSTRPVARTQMIFTRIPGRREILMAAGDAFEQIPEPPFLVAVTQEDVWRYDIDADRWTELDTQNKPEPARNHRAYTMISDRLLLVQGGDAQGDLTTDDTCPAPLFCLIPASPTSDTFVYDIVGERWSQLDLPTGAPPARRSAMRAVEGTVYLFGGYGWDGDNAVGKIANPYTWQLSLRRHMP